MIRRYCCGNCGRMFEANYGELIYDEHYNTLIARCICPYCKNNIAYEMIENGTEKTGIREDHKDVILKIAVFDNDKSNLDVSLLKTGVFNYNIGGLL